MKNYALIVVAILLESFSVTYAYDSYYKDYSETHKKEVAVLIIAYNRPDYLRKCIQSIEQNEEAVSIPFIFALDGGPQSKQEEIIDLILKSNIKEKILLVRERNYGNPKNYIDAKRFAFDWCKFKKIIVLEDDLVISPNYFTLLLNMYTWAKKNFNKIGVVQVWSYCYLSQEEKNKQLSIVQENIRQWSFVTYCMDRACWNTIKKDMYYYESIVDQIPQTKNYDRQRSKPGLSKLGNELRKWVRMLTLNKLKKMKTKIIKKHLIDKYLSPMFSPNLDDIMGFLFYFYDLIKLETVVNRVIHIGECGITYNAKTYKERKFNEIKLDNFEDDKNIKTFIFKKSKK